MSTSQQTVIYKSVIISLCTMFNTKPEHGDIYINCKNFIRLINNYYIYSTPPLSVLDFPREYFPFTLKSETPILYTNTYLFGSNEPLILSQNKMITDLKLTCLIMTLLHIFFKRNPNNLLSRIDSLRDPKVILTNLYQTLYNTNKQSIFEYIGEVVSYIDIEDTTKFLLSVFNEYRTFESILSAYRNTYGVHYDFFR